MARLTAKNIPGRPALGSPQTLSRDHRTIAFHLSGKGRPVLLIPSLGRPASDFNELAQMLNHNGFQTAAIDPPGCGDSSFPAAPLSLADLADDAYAVSRALSAHPMPLIGHAFGNRLARALASFHPQSAAAVILIAAGGQAPVPPRARRDLTACFFTFLPAFWRKRFIARGFFARGNPIPSHWITGWHPRTATLQGQALRLTPAQEWRSAGSAPLLVIQGAEDAIAPPQIAARVLKEALGARVRVKEIPRAGHALLPEQPDLIAQAVLSFLKGLP